jgi:hypothetical protein
MTFALSQRSLNNLTGVQPALVAVVKRAIQITKVDFGVIDDAMKAAAIELDTPIKWGAAWTVQDIRKWHGTMASAMNSYIDERRKQGRRPFLDSPHFELP